MYLVQLLLPEAAGPDAALVQVQGELTERFGSLVAYRRPAAGSAWPAEARNEGVVIVEVTSEGWDVEWWRSYRARLERRFGLDDLVIRAIKIERA